MTISGLRDGRVTLKRGPDIWRGAFKRGDLHQNSQAYVPLNRDRGRYNLPKVFDPVLGSPV